MWSLHKNVECHIRVALNLISTWKLNKKKKLEFCTEQHLGNNEVYGCSTQHGIAQCCSHMIIISAEASSRDLSSRKHPAHVWSLQSAQHMCPILYTHTFSLKAENFAKLGTSYYGRGGQTNDCEPVPFAINKLDSCCIQLRYVVENIHFRFHFHHITWQVWNP